ncbi:MAG TPA: type II secretion system F family protein [Dehalococcoidia bacterium]|nr:type II secretion system F family protein [Dehalococcoidia bacterium]
MVTALAAGAAVLAFIAVVLPVAALSADAHSPARARLSGEWRSPLPAEKPSSGRVLLRRGPTTHLTVVGWVLQRRQLGTYIQRTLQAAGWTLTPSEFVLLSLVAGGLGGLVTTVLGLTPVLGIAAVAGGALVPWVILRQARARRLKLVHAQLVDAFTLIAGAMRSGSNLTQALEATMRELPEPAREEFLHTLEELQVGATVEEAFGNLGERVQSPDLDLVITAIVIQRQVGGNLAGILETTADTMRQRQRIRGEIKSLTAQGRLSGLIIGLLPVAVFLMLTFINPEYMEPLTTTNTGRLVLGLGVGLEAMGFFVIRRIVSIEV